MIRILQISDIHFLSGEAEEDPNVLMRQRLFDDIDDLVKAKGEIDTILVCGDIAAKAQEEEYDNAFAFLKELAQHCGCSLDDVCVVPGNHDVNWNEHNTSWNLVREQLFDKTRADKTINSWKREEPLAIHLLHAPFMNYVRKICIPCNCVEGISERCMMGEMNFKGQKLYWRRKIGVESGRDVIVYGMNTALISSSNDLDLQKNTTGQAMFLPQIAYNVVGKSHEILLSMMHHPTPYIMDGDKIKRELDQRFKVQFFGHVHIQSSDNTDNIKIFSGALQPETVEEKKGYIPVYNFLELSVKEDNSCNGELCIDLYSRKWDGSRFVQLCEQEAERLTTSLTHSSSWEKNTGNEDKTNLDDVVSTPAATMKSVSEISYIFLNMRDVKKVINNIYPDSYNPLMPDMKNRLLFLQRVKRDNKYKELEEQISK